MNGNKTWEPTDMLEVTLAEPDDFLKVKETLTRIGVPVFTTGESKNTLCQSCHILHKQGRYFIVHFKELFLLDGKEADFSDDDRRRRNTIAILLSDWGLVDLTVKPNETTDLKQIKILPFREKANWNLEVKYTIGTKK